MSTETKSLGGFQVDPEPKPVPAKPTFAYMIANGNRKCRRKHEAILKRISRKKGK